MYAWMYIMPDPFVAYYLFSHPSKGEIQIMLKHIRLFAVSQFSFAQFLPEAFQSQVRHVNFFYLNSILLAVNLKGFYFFSEQGRFPKY